MSTRIALSIWIVLCITLGAEALADIVGADFPELLGQDEFKRDVWLIAIKATLFSTGTGLAIASIVVATAMLLAALLYAADMHRTTRLVEFLGDAIDSIPALLWILVVASVFRESLAVVSLLAFSIVTLPGVVRIVHGEIVRIGSSEFVEAAISLGTQKGLIFFRHIAPNAQAVLIPVFFQVLGNAVAVTGAIGILGMGSRSDIDLGVMLFRGKEQFFESSKLLVLGFGGYLLIFWSIIAALQTDEKRSRRPAELTVS